MLPGFAQLDISSGKALIMILSLGSQQMGNTQPCSDLLNVEVEVYLRPKIARPTRVYLSMILSVNRSALPQPSSRVYLSLGHSRARFQYMMPTPES
jgi:hypothetical protein